MLCECFIVWFSPIYLYLISPSATVWLSNVPSYHVLNSPHCVTTKEESMSSKGSVGSWFSSLESQLPSFLWSIQLHHTAPWGAAPTQAQKLWATNCAWTSKLVHQYNPSLFTVRGCYSDYMSYFSQCWNKMPNKANLRTDRVHVAEGMRQLITLHTQAESWILMINSSYLLFSPELQPMEQWHPQLTWVFPPQ